jgi:hypothetical protein
MIANPEISLSYPLTYREFVAGYKLGVRQRLFALVPYIVARFLGPFVAGLFLLLAIFSFTSGHRDAVAGTIPVILLCALMPMIYLYSWRSGFKNLQRDSAKNPQMTFQADGVSFVGRIDGMGEMTWLWATTDSISQNKRVVLVSARRGCFVIIPRYAISDSQLRRLQELHKENKA